MMWCHYLKIAWRELRRDKVQATVRIAGIAIGLVAFLLGGYWWYWETHFDSFHPHADRLYAITTGGMIESADGKEAGLNQLHKDDAAYFARVVPEIEQMCLVNKLYYAVEKEGSIRTLFALQVDSVFFRLFAHHFLDGGYRGILWDGTSVILSRKLAMEYFGTVRCSGKQIDLGKDREGDEMTYRVAGVVENYPADSEFVFEMLLCNAPMYNQRGRTTAYVRLKKGVDVESVKQKISGHKSLAVDPDRIERPEEWKFSLCSLPEVHLTCSPELGSRFRNIRMLALAGLLAFISAMMNHLVLFMGQQQKKSREYITRISLGSSAGNVAVKMYVELLLPVLLACGIALCLIEIVFPAYQRFTMIVPQTSLEVGRQIERVGLWGGTLRYMAGMVGTFLLASAVPVGFMLRQHRHAIYGRSTSFPALIGFRRFLIIGQIFIGALFFVVAGGMYRQLYFLKHKDRGIQTDHIVQIDLGYKTAERMDPEQFRKELVASPYIEDVTSTAAPVLSPHGIYYGNETGFVPVEGREAAKSKNPAMEDYLFKIKENFFTFFGIGLKEGTLIGSGNPEDYIVNETGARELGFSDLVQRKPIAGIIRDFHYAPLRYPVRKVFFCVEREKYPFPTYLYTYVKYRPDREKQAFRHIQEVVRKYDCGEVETTQRYTKLSSVIEDFDRPEEVIFTSFSILAALCILISSFGIYTLVAFATEQRKKEIAIRKVNGGGLTDIIGLFLKEYLWLLSMGVGIALLLGYRLLQIWLETYAVHIHLNAGLFLAVAFVTTVLVVGSVAAQVKKAMGTDPAVALKDN